MKRLMLILILCSISPIKLFSQTVLVPGDILFVGFKTSTDDEAGNDCVKLVTLKSLECNTVFVITDNNWNNSTDSWVCNNDEFATQITCNVPIMAGSVFYIDLDNSGGVATCSGGSITKVNFGTSSTFGTNYGLNDEGDNLFILQGTHAAPTFVSALKHSGAFANATCATKNNTALPDNLSLATSAIVMASSQDQWHYNCNAGFSGTKAALTSLLLSNANWTFTTGQSWNDLSCLFNITDDPILTSPTGSIAVSGAGCGCLANCNLSQFGGVNCGAGVTSNCTAGYQNMSTSIVVPSGCTFTVTATMRIRSSCSASGADGNCSTCDVLKVDIAAGAKAFQQGGSNATLNDSYTLAGPGTIVVSGKANRADEIITYTIGIPCGPCLTTLPVELTAFSASIEDKQVKLDWMTYTETNNAYFTIEKSKDGVEWEVLYIMSGQGNSNQSHLYTLFDSSPFEGESFYKLSQTDFNGESKELKIESVNFSKAKIIKEYTLLGQEADEFSKGIIIQVLDDNSIRKIYR